MIMEAKGKIIAVLPLQSGTSKSSGKAWSSQQYVMEIPGDYPKKMCFQVFGAEKIREAGINLGDTVSVNFDIDANEYNGKWFNRINAWKVSKDASAAPPVAPPPVTQNDDMPF